MTLAPCTGCGRHVRLDEASCPFCGEGVAERPRVPSTRVGRLTRAAIFYLGASAAVVGCDDPGPAAIYGGPPPPETIAQPYGAPADPPPEPPPDTPEEPEAEDGPLVPE